MELELRQALAGGELAMYYQPVVDVRRGRVTGFEALLRWNHPRRGVVGPADFIPLAEEIGLIGPLGEWVLRQACVEAAAWPGDLKVAINLSPVQFRRTNLQDVVITALAVSRLPAERLELEITEGVLIENTEATLDILHRLRAFGIRIVMDDFGTGYSSLGYLRKFRFDRLKIDGSFVRDLGEESGEALAIVRAVAGLCSSLEMLVTAEGVETAEQLRKLTNEGCDTIQGYYFGAARPASEIPSVIEHLERRVLPALLAAKGKSPARVVA